METNIAIKEYQITSTFKSYYVVWKLNVPSGHVISDNSFKSYYVVWKPPKRQTKTKTTGSLNRTMQYGNILMKGEHSNSLQSLNRTMQYGNHTFGEKFRFFFCVFKSYYVVWKLCFSSCFIYFYYGLNRTMQYGNSFLYREIDRIFSV